MCGHITRTWEIEIKDRWSQNVKKASPLEKDYRTKVLFSSVTSGKTTTATTKKKKRFILEKVARFEDISSITFCAMINLLVWLINSKSGRHLNVLN